MKDSEYMLGQGKGQGENDADRLREQNKHGINEQSAAFVARVLPQWNQDATRVLILGIGAGDEFAIWGRVSPTIPLIAGIDTNPAKVAAAAQRAHELGLDQQAAVTVGKMQDLSPFADESLDIVTVRLGLQHLTAQDRDQTLWEVHRVLRSGGLFLAEDFDVPTEDVTPPHPSHAFLRERFLSLYDRFQTEPWMGSGLTEAMETHNLTIIHEQTYQTRTSGSPSERPFKMAHLAIYQAVKVPITSLGLSSPEEYDAHLNQFAEHLRNPETTSIAPIMHQVAAVKL